MAQVDTGLGWSAKGEYLLSTPQLMGNINEVITPVDLPHVAYNVTPDIATIMSGGAYFYVQGVKYYLMVATNEYSGKVGVGLLNVTRNNSVVIYIASWESSGEDAGIGRYSVYVTDGVTRWGARNFAARPLTRQASTGMYYNETTTLTISGFPGANGPATDGSILTATAELNSFDDLAPVYLGSSTPVYKLYGGYAVACVAKWLTPEGNTLISPILISTAPLATAMTYDGTTPAECTEFTFVKSGLHFYMTIIPGLDITEYIIVNVSIQNLDLRQFAAALPQKVFELIASPTFSNIQILTSPDPYESEGAGTIEDGGGGDDVDDDPVDEETMPIPAVVGLGFSTIYVPTQTDLYNLAAYLWGGNLDLDSFLRLFANPMDSILGLSAVPLVLSGTYEPIYLGGQQLQGITMPRYTGRTAVKVDMGTVTIKERWGAYLDYDPYTELAVYVPFIGIKNIKADDVMGKTIRLMYDIDILSGACIAYIRPEGGSPLYEWSGQCAMQIPITGANWDNIFNTAINTAATLGGALFAPASAPVLGSAVASAASQAIAAKPRIERSGAMNGVTGFLGQLRPYIIRTIPEAYIPNDQNKFIGYPSYISVNLGSLTGYNEIASIHLENIPATGDELSELESILKGGVIF